jgi:low affinity Fe/Cu permease
MRKLRGCDQPQEGGGKLALPAPTRERVKPWRPSASSDDSSPKSDLVAHPLAFAVWLLYALLWLAIEPDTLDWHGFATLVTWFMTLITQRAGDRDTQALQAKLDELLRTVGPADDTLTDIDKLEPEDIKRLRDKA